MSDAPIVLAGGRRLVRGSRRRSGAARSASRCISRESRRRGAHGAAAREDE